MHDDVGKCGRPEIQFFIRTYMCNCKRGIVLRDASHPAVSSCRMCRRNSLLTQGIHGRCGATAARDCVCAGGSPTVNVNVNVSNCATKRHSRAYVVYLTDFYVLAAR